MRSGVSSRYSGKEGYWLGIFSTLILRSIDERSLVYFADCPTYLLEAYADSGEGVDRAGGFAVQGLGGMLIRKVDGDYNNVVGFPAASFFKLLDMMIEEDDDFLSLWS